MKVRIKPSHISVGVRIVVVSLLMGMVISWVVWIVSSLTFESSLVVGWATWIIAYGLLLNRFWRSPVANTAVVLQNPLLGADKKRLLTSMSEAKVFSGQRVIFEGLNATWPWEEMVQEPIDLKKVSPLGGTIEAQTSDAKVVSITWIAAMVPIPDSSLVNFYRTDEKSAEQFYTADIQATIEEITRGETAEHIMSNLKSFYGDRLKNLYGADKLTKEERATGRCVDTDRIFVSEFDKSATSKAADEANANASLFATALRTILAECGDDPVVRQIAVAAVLKGKFDPNIITLQNTGRGR